MNTDRFNRQLHPGGLSGNMTGHVNLYDNSLYVGGGVVMANPSLIAFKPGVSGTVGYIFGEKSAQGTRDFLAGDGAQGLVSIPTPFGANAIAAITHAYGGPTAIEFGVGQPGAVSFGILPWGARQTSNRKNTIGGYMAVGGSPNPEQWAKMSRKQKTWYWICVAAACTFIGALLIKDFFG